MKKYLIIFLLISLLFCSEAAATTQSSTCKTRTTHACLMDFVLTSDTQVSFTWNFILAKPSDHWTASVETQNLLTEYCTFDSIGGSQYTCTATLPAGDYQMYFAEYDHNSTVVFSLNY